ncbi:ROK family transcriptional regulator [Microbacterium sp. EST19A]|uniref:ROK family transcriptional regulator n=1 Tax=Microbacterium sp. EST19A TaxID=2862681 RepID=UPI001CBF01DF|nr:ROK family transcriptional regulator [Microbacterium sp. EST19A]
MDRIATATSDQMLELRRANSARCAEVIRSAGSMTIAEVAEATALSRPTVRARLQDLYDAGLLIEVAAAAPTGAGRPASRFSFVADAAIVAGLELAKHVERLLVTDLVGRELWHGERPVTIKSAQERLDSAVEWVKDTAAGLGKKLVRVGVAVPGSMDPSGVFIEAAAFVEWRGHAVPPIIRAAFDVPTDTLHDLAAAMSTERRMGAAKDVDTFVVPVLWHRVSAGIVLEGRVYGGTNGRSGNIQQRFSAAQNHLDDAEWPSDPDVSALVVAAADGDPAADASLDRFAALAAEQIAMLQLVIDPELIVLHGPLAVHDALVERVVAHLARDLPIVAPVVVSEFGQFGTVIGAALTALDGAAEDLIGPGMAPHLLDRTRLSSAISGRRTVLV